MHVCVLVTLKYNSRLNTSAYVHSNTHGDTKTYGNTKSPIFLSPNPPSFDYFQVGRRPGSLRCTFCTRETTEEGDRGQDRNRDPAEILTGEEGWTEVSLDDKNQSTLKLFAHNIKFLQYVMYMSYGDFQEKFLLKKYIYYIQIYAIKTKCNKSAMGQSVNLN